jgi:hypothetical protein
VRKSHTRAELEKKVGEKHAPGLKTWALCLFGSIVQVSPATAELVQLKIETFEP